MLSIRRITRREWEDLHRDYKGITTILVCRHCGDWTFPWRPDLFPAKCAAENGHEWTERRQKTMLSRDERGRTVLEFVEVVEFEALEEMAAEAFHLDAYAEKYGEG